MAHEVDEAPLRNAGEDGTLSGWSPTVNGTQAILAADASGAGAVYKGLAIGSNGSGNVLFATDFHNGVVDIYGPNFQYLSSFTDPAPQ